MRSTYLNVQHPITSQFVQSTSGLEKATPTRKSSSYKLSVSGLFLRENRKEFDKLKGPFVAFGSRNNVQYCNTEQ